MEISSFTPTQGAPGATVSITIPATGAPLDMAVANTSVLIGGEPQMTLESVTSDGRVDGDFTLTATVDDNAQSGELMVIVTSRIGMMHALSDETFTVKRNAEEPVIQNMNPRQNRRGTQVTITGQHLDEIQYVRIGNIAIQSIVHNGETQIRFMIPMTAQTGRQRVSGQSEEYGRINAPIMFEVLDAQ